MINVWGKNNQYCLYRSLAINILLNEKKPAKRKGQKIMMLLASNYESHKAKVSLGGFLRANFIISPNRRDSLLVLDNCRILFVAGGNGKKGYTKIKEIRGNEISSVLRFRATKEPS